MAEPQNSGELLLPVCIPENEIRDLISAVDLYRVMRKGGQEYVAFNAVLQAIDRINTPEQSPCLEGITGNGFGCEIYETWHEAMDFYPNDPYARVADPDAPRLSLKWVTFEQATTFDILPDWLQGVIDFFGEQFSGYLPNDCVLVPDDAFALQPYQVISDLLLGNFDIPIATVTIKLQGSGVAGVELLNVPLGGRAIIIRDINPTLESILDVIQDTLSPGDEGILNDLQFVELNRDLLSIPSETASTQIQEVEFNEDGDHTLRIWFFPVFNEEVPFIFPFGGIRSVRVCDNMKVIGVQSDTVTNRSILRQGAIGVSTQADFYDALIRYETEKANRWLFATDKANVRAGVTIDPKTGIVTVEDSSVSNVDLTENSSEARNGGAYAVAKNFAKLIEDVNDYNTAGYTVDTSFTLFNTVAQVISDAAQAAKDLLSDYFTFLATEDPVTIISVPNLAEKLYCQGLQEGFLAYCLSENYSEDELNYLLNFYNSLPSGTINRWFDSGRSAPRSDYFNYSCYIRGGLVFDFNTYTDTTQSQLLSEFVGLSNRRYRVKLTGKLIGTDVSFDGAYLTDNGVRSRVDFSSFGLSVPGTSGFNLKPPAGVPFSEQGYAYTINYSSGVTIGTTSTINARLGTTLANKNFTSGEIRVDLVDLGAI